MGGGKKKQSLSKADKEQKKTGPEERKKAGPVAEKKTADIIGPNPKDTKTIAELKKMKFVTPYIIASKYSLRLSVAKDLLEQLRMKGDLELVSKSRNLSIYRPVT